MEKRIGVGKMIRVTTKDGRTFIGTLTGYAEICQGEDIMEEIYIEGCAEKKLILKMAELKDISEMETYFLFKGN
jgi:hypothetical protein